MDKKSFLDDFIRRIKDTKTTRWIRFGIVSLVFFLWVAWMDRWWLAIFWLLLLDIYILGYIPFTWWKESKSKVTQTVMGWVDAIVYALVLVYFVFAFMGQNYEIPSSSLEKSLLTGDFLWVNKMVYGPRVPMTPVHFPLVHNKLFGMQSYAEWPQNEYRRLKGFRKVETGDIVVFNFPAGDTVLTRYEDVRPEYYDQLVEIYGREQILANPQEFGEVKYRPVDRRQNYVKRAVGLPGERIRISNDTVYIDGEMQPFPTEVQYNYVFATDMPLYDDQMHDLGISASDLVTLNGQADPAILTRLVPGSNENCYFYQAPLTAAMLEAMPGIKGYNKLNTLQQNTDFIFPYSSAGTWTCSNFGGADGLLIPAKGMTIPLDEDAWKRYRRVIRNYEGHDAYFDEASGKVIIDGAPADTYTFGMDYYWMMGDNRDNSLDSRFWGFVPEDHIVGTPMLLLASFDRERGLFNGKIRWNRILRNPNSDKDNKFAR